jgi:2-oxo-3-hexenedioate decarboxylase
MMDLSAPAHDLLAAFDRGQVITPLSSRISGFDLDAAYAIEAELARTRRAQGHATVGRKVGYANKAVWRALKLETLVWAHMYDDTVRYLRGPSEGGPHEAGVGAALRRPFELSLATMCSPKIEPEIVFKLKAALTPGLTEPADILRAVEWLALGFEIIDCPFPDWKFQPTDFVAAFGLHRALFVGAPLAVDETNIATLAEQLPRFAVRLTRGGDLIAEGSGRNSLRSPALCLGELASAIARRPEAEPLAAGELVSSGTLTESQPMAADQAWAATVDGLDLPPLTLHTTKP